MNSNVKSAATSKVARLLPGTILIHPALLVVADL
jgi:hypothetical protein